MTIRSSSTLLLGAGVVCFGVGEGIWAFSESKLCQEVPLPGWADLAYLASYPLLAAGVFSIPVRPLVKGERGRVMLDSLTVLAAVFTFSWHLLLGPILLQSDQSLLVRVLETIYPFGDLGLLLCMLILTLRQPTPYLIVPIRLLMAGMLSVIVADTAFCYLTLSGQYQSGSMLDLGWSTGYMLIALAGRMMRPGSDKTVETPPLSLWQTLLPYCFVPPAFLLMLYSTLFPCDRNLDLGVLVGTTLLTWLVMMRQMFAIIENRALYTDMRNAFVLMKTQSREDAAHNLRLEEMASDLVTMQAELVSSHLALEAVNTRMSEANARLEALAMTDGMTGLANHRAFQERLRSEIDRAHRTGSLLSLMLLDVDHFKSFNDTFGHPAGDMALQEVARLIRASIRSSDVAARYGGEEFAVILPDTDLEGAFAVAERLRAMIESHVFPFRPITISVGMALASLDGAEGIIQRADSALYTAKQAGRNCISPVVVSPEPCSERACVGEQTA